MTGRVRILFEAQDRITRLMGRIDGAMRRVQTTGRSAFQRINSYLTTTAERFNNATQSANGFANTLRNAFAGAAIIAFGTSAIQAQRQVESLDNSIRFASGAEATANMQHLDQVTQALGLNALSAKEGYAMLAGSFKDTRLAGQPMRDVFTGVSQAAAALGLDAEQTKGTFLALGQIMSKGKVQAEELRGQLGERIPGAFQIAARAMGMTTMELDNALASGKIMAEDFLPAFAREMQKTFGEAAAKNANSLNARLNRLQNGLLDLKLAFFEAFEPFITRGIAVATTMTQVLGPALYKVGQIIMNISRFVERNVSWIGPLVAGLIAYKVAVAAIVGISRAWMAIQTAISLINPVGLAIAGIAAFITLLVIAYQRSETFRGVIMAIWETVKKYFGLIADYANATKDVLVGVFTLDLDKIRSGLKSQAKILSNYYSDLGQAAIIGYNKGVNQTVELPDIVKKLSGGVSSLTGGVIPSGIDPTSSGGSDTTKAIGNNISGGGTKPTNITINLGKFQDQVNIYAANVKEGAAQVREIIEEEFLRLLNGANQAI